MKTITPLLLALLLVGCSSNPNTNNSNFKMADSGVNTPKQADTTAHQPVANTTSQPSAQAPTPNNSTPVTDASTASVDLPSMLASSSIKFDQNFNPVATITLHNTTAKEIDEVMFRFTFTNHSLSDGPIDLVAASDYSSYVNYTLQLHPSDTQTIEVNIPLPKMKAFDTPIIFITKVRYYDGTIDTDDR